MNLEDIRKTLASISFKRSAIDIPWRWEVEVLRAGSYNGCFMDDNYHEGFRIRTIYTRPDVETGEVKEGYGRWWEVATDVSESGVVKTAYAACRMILEHELMESFLYKGWKPFDPHHSLADLKSAALSRADHPE